MSIARRNILAMLGLAPAATAAMNTETMASDLGAPYRTTTLDAERTAAAFEKLATAIRNHHVNVDALQVVSELGGPQTKWLTQVMTVRLEIVDPGKV